MNIAIIQARMSSSRLPGKVLKKFCNIPNLQHVYNRVSESKYIDKVLVATSTNESDNAIAQFCHKVEIPVFRGEEHDVLDRFYKAAVVSECKDEDVLIRITADCPLIDSEVIDVLINEYSCGGMDYVSNTLVTTYPDGLDAEVFSFKALACAWRDAKLPSEREHVTPYIKKNPDIFSVHNVKNSIDYSELRWTLDEVADYKLISIIYDELYPNNKNFKMMDILRLLRRRPELRQINNIYERNEGYSKSLELDEIFLRQDGSNE